MSNLYNPIFDRKVTGNFDKHKSFKSLIGGTGGYFLEDEMNEMQWIQNEARTEILKSQFHSGIVYDKENRLILQNNENYIPNLFSFSPTKALINGYLIDLRGNLGRLYDNNGFNNVLLHDSPEDGFRDDFVYLEVKFKIVKVGDEIWFNGNEDNVNGVIENDLFDRRINGETTRRIQLQWKIKTVKGIDFESFKDGFDNQFKNGNIQNYNVRDREYYSFWRSDLNLDQKNNFSDKGLWVCGTGVSGDFETFDGYIYAIPLFKVSRRNSKPYSESNINGGIAYVPNNGSISDRPDNKYYNIIYKDDIIDLRYYNDFNKIDYDNILCENFEKLLTGKLSSNKNNEVIKEYFGVEPIGKDDNTILYATFNNNSLNNLINNLPPTLSSNGKYEFVNSVEQDGIVLNNKYLSYSLTSVSLNEARVSFFIKLMDVDNKNIFSLKNNTSNVLSLSIIDGYIVVKNNTSILLSYSLLDSGLRLNEFSHICIAWSKSKNLIYLVVNGNVITSNSLVGKFSSTQINNCIVGYNDINEYYCNDCILDEFEISKICNYGFSNLPIDFKNGFAKLSIDTQLGRRNYKNISSNSIMTKQISVRSNSSGIAEFSVNALTSSIFSNLTPRLLHDNEAILANAIWNGLGTKTLTCTINNLGNNVDYNFMLIYELIFDSNCGFKHKPEKVIKVHAEKFDQEFFPVRIDKKIEEFPIDKLNIINNKVENYLLKKCVVYNSFFDTKLGFSVAIKDYLTNNNGTSLTINKNMYPEPIINIYDINVVNSVDKKHIIKNIKNNKDNFIIELNQSIKPADVIEVIMCLEKSSCIYNHIEGGIEELTRCQKISFFGDGIKKKFEQRLDSRVLTTLSSNINGVLKTIVYIDGFLQEVDVELKDNFVIYTFENAPANKKSIESYITLEYSPLKSERLEIWYEYIKYQGLSDKNYIESLNGCSIIYNLNHLFSITEGLSYNIENNLNKEMISSINLPSINYIDSLLTQTSIVDEATNIKGAITYAKSINGNEVPLLSKLNIILSDKKINRGYCGSISINNKSFYSHVKCKVNTPHLNILPFLLKDKNDKIILCVITTFNDKELIYIDGRELQSAFDVFNLDKNILIK